VEPDRGGLGPGDYRNHLAKAGALGLDDQQRHQRPADPLTAAVMADVD
jgi:hypothetical protein